MAVGDQDGRPRTLGDLPFRRRAMVRWLNPGGVVSTGVQAGLSGVIGRYADRRELQGALATPALLDLSGRERLWLDYVADIGDGFNATYAVASLLAADTLTVAHHHGDDHETAAGSLLVFGGDLVYPVASDRAYHDRLVGPLTAALPATGDGQPRHLVALPGNHDWYDGLTTFLRLFCQPGRIGGWATRQTRSYFAVRLPHRWWLWGIDIQFDFRVDEPQLAYFEEIAEQLDSGDNVILCTAKPSWVREGLRGDDVYADPGSRRNLEYVERRVLAPKGITPVLTLAGDLHHYARYESDTPGLAPRHKITAGGGGAFLYPTHTLPEQAHWPRHGADGSRADDRYRRRVVYPPEATSRRRRWAALWAPLTNGGLVAAIGAIYLALVWTLQAGLAGPSVGAALGAASGGDLAGALLREPAGVALALVVLAGLVGFADSPRVAGRLGLGLAHGAAHLAVALAAAWAAGRLAGEAPGGWVAAALVGVVGVGGGLAGALVTGAYLVISHVVFGRHANEAFSAQHIADYKSFVRLHLDADGTLTVYPIAIPRVPRRWDTRPDAGAEAPWMVPLDGPIPARLIEPPVVIRPGDGATTAS